MSIKKTMSLLPMCLGLWGIVLYVLIATEPVALVLPCLYAIYCGLLCLGRAMFGPQDNTTEIINNSDLLQPDKYSTFGKICWSFVCGPLYFSNVIGSLINLGIRKLIYK